MNRQYMEFLGARTLSAGGTMSLKMASDQDDPRSKRPVHLEQDDKMAAERFYAFLLDNGLVDASVLDRALRASEATMERFDHVLSKLGLVSEADLAAAFSKYLSLSLVLPNDIPPDALLTDVIGTEFIRRNKVMPLMMDDRTLVVGVVDAFNQESTRALEFLTGRSVSVKIFAPTDFERAFEALYMDRHATAGGTYLSNLFDASEVDVQRLRDIASEAPVIRLVNQLIASAVQSGASDIHIEPNIETVLVRYRIDGLLRTAQSLKPSLRAAVTSRIKIMAKLDIAERRLPQDGRVKLAVRGVDIDFRVSTTPTIFGESVVIRILDRSRVKLDFDSLGFNSDHVAMIKDLLVQPNGIILVTGPTGSGKTTTLYTMLKMLNCTENKVFTVEDPIEYQFKGINQVQVHPGIGLTFPHALRSILRQDPDIIMIGEIRDLETAKIAIQAALTGHLVLSTVHTNSAAATITRLIDMGLEHFLLASSIKGVIAQRLVRKLCPACSAPDDRAPALISERLRTVRKLETAGTPNFRTARGCPDCAGTGFSGRTTIAETLAMTPAMHPLIAANASDSEIETVARKHGMSTMYESGALKFWRGETTLEEVLRSTRSIHA